MKYWLNIVFFTLVVLITSFLLSAVAKTYSNVPIEILITVGVIIGYVFGSFSVMNRIKKEMEEVMKEISDPNQNGKSK